MRCFARMLCGTAVLGLGVAAGLSAPPIGFADAWAATAPGAPPSMLTWTPEQQRRFYPAMESVFPVHVVHRGPKVRPLAPAPGPFDPKLHWDGRDWTVDAYMRAYRVSGLIVLKAGDIILERYGLGRTEGERWTSFSVAKSITSLLVGAAIQDGRIELEDPVERFVPELGASAYAGVTLRQLLMMSSGVSWNEDYEDPASDIRKAGALKSDAETFAYLRALPRAHPPGAVFHYNTLETDLVGRMLSRAVGGSLSDYLSAKIWKPYGMEKDAVWVVDAEGHEWGGSSISMTLRDYARVGQFVLEGGRAQGRPVTAQGYLEAATRVEIANGHPAPRGYGYFWWIGARAYEASGIFGQSILVYPADRIVIVVNSAWPRAGGEELFGALSKFQGALHAAVMARGGQP